MENQKKKILKLESKESDDLSEFIVYDWMLKDIYVGYLGMPVSLSIEIECRQNIGDFTKCVGERAYWKFQFESEDI